MDGGAAAAIVRATPGPSVGDGTNGKAADAERCGAGWRDVASLGASYGIGREFRGGGDRVYCARLYEWRGGRSAASGNCDRQRLHTPGRGPSRACNGEQGATCGLATAPHPSAAATMTDAAGSAPARVEACDAGVSRGGGAEDAGADSAIGSLPPASVSNSRGPVVA